MIIKKGILDFYRYNKGTFYVGYIVIDWEEEFYLVCMVNQKGTLGYRRVAKRLFEKENGIEILQHLATHPPSVILTENIEEKNEVLDEISLKELKDLYQQIRTK